MVNSTRRNYIIRKLKVLVNLVENWQAYQSAD